MIKVLVVDDDSNRRKGIINSINEEFYDEVFCDYVDCVFDAKQKLKEYFDIVILDVNLPYRPGRSASDEHSLNLLYELSEADAGMKAPGQIVGITAYDNSFTVAEEEFSKYIKGLIFWKPNSSEGIDSLINIIGYAIKSEKGRGSEYNYDLCILTALMEESKYVDEINWNWSPSKLIDESLYYREGDFLSGGKKYRVVQVTSQRMGLVNAAARAARVLEVFKPRFIAMCGICGGFDARGVSEGDLIFAETSWEVFSGKYDETSSFLPRQEPYQRSVPTWLLENVRVFNKNISNESILKSMKIHVGPLACSSAVIANSKVIEEILTSVNRKALGVEMEIFAMYSAALDSRIPRATPFAVKGVSDLADAKKADSGREAPARNSALFLKCFFEERMSEIVHLAGTA